MKKSDLFLMALRNLRNRKTRTKLTVIGVVIGTCAIVIMVSIGIGIDKMITAQYQADSSLNKITVYGTDSEPDEGETALPFNDKAVEYIKSIENVKMVVPSIYIGDSVVVSRGKYKLQWVNIKGIDLASMEAMGYTLKEGSFAGADKSNTVYFGENVVTNFVDNQGNSVKYRFDEDYNIIDCEIDPMKDIFFIEPAVYSENGEGVYSTAAVTPKRIRVGGVLKRDYSIDYETDYGIYIDIDTAIDLLQQYNKLNSVHGNDFTYSEIEVFVDNMDHVESVQKVLKEKGFGCYSDKEELEYTKKVMMAVQLVLGAIGAISMFVAAFGISNTMVMSVYERTKEIGIMKVLGCDIDDIKRLFLYEAGAIGLMGGTIGVFISVIVSIIANVVARAVVTSMGEMDEGMLICVSSVPLWLIFSGILFSVLVGVLAGLSPAKRSVKVSALTAIHNE